MSARIERGVALGSILVPERARNALVLGLVALLVAAVVVPGCYDYDDDYYDDDYYDDDNGSSFYAFQYDRVFALATGVETFTWDSIYDQVFVEFEAWDFLGSVLVEVFDAANALIYLEEHLGAGGYQFDTDQTLPGIAGQWTIRITTTAADGQVQVILY